MIKDLIVWGIIAVFCLIFLYAEKKLRGYLKNESERQIIPTNTGQFILRINKLNGIVVVVGLVMGLVMSVMIIVVKAPVVIIGIILLIFWGPGIPSWLYYQNHTLKFDDKIIEVRNFLGKEKSIKWSDISNISFSRFSQLLTITDTHGVKIKIHEHLVGLRTFVKTIEEKTHWTAEQLKIPILK